MDINKQTGATIKMLREATGMSLNDLAKKIHRSKSSVSKYESGVVRMDLRTLEEIADALGVSMRTLLFSQSDAGSNSRDDSIKLFLISSEDISEDAVAQMYLYFYGGELAVVREALLEINRHTGDTRMFCDPYEKRGGLGFSFMYIGNIIYFDSKYRMTLRNRFDENDVFMMQWADAKSGSETLMGLLSYFASGQFNSFSTKVLLSNNRLKVDDDIKALLGLSKEEMKTIRKRNALYGSVRPQEFIPSGTIRK